MSDLNILDIAAVAWLILCWVGYTRYAEKRASAGNLIGVMHRRRIDWMMRMLERENRMVDLQIINSALNNATFFASTTANRPARIKIVVEAKNVALLSALLMI